MENNKSYKVIISLPRIEYSNQSENFIFIKVLNSEEVAEYLSCGFADWHKTALQQLQRYSMFNQQLLDIQNRVEVGVNLKSRTFGRSGK